MLPRVFVRLTGLLREQTDGFGKSPITQKASTTGHQDIAGPIQGVIHALEVSFPPAVFVNLVQYDERHFVGGALRNEGRRTLGLETPELYVILL